MSGDTSLTFAQGRAATLRRIQRDVEIRAANLAASAKINVQDCLTYETLVLSSDSLTDKQKADVAFLRHASEAVMEAVADSVKMALEGLRAGHTLYDLLGARPIPTYKAIIGGDVRAGIVSAVEDVKILMMTLNSKELKEQIFKDIVASKDFSPDLHWTLNAVLNISVNVVHDGVMFPLNENILEKMHKPDVMEYEDGTVVHTPSNMLGRLWANIPPLGHHTGPDGRRSKKLKPLWPPLKVKVEIKPEELPPGSVPFMRALTGEGASAAQAVAPSAPDTPAALHHEWDADMGYRETALGVYDVFQDRHFQAIRRGSYARDSGLPAVNEKAVQDMAVDLFHHLRARMGELIMQPPSLTGRFRDGLERASQDIGSEIAALALPERKMDTVKERILSKLKQAWAKNLRDVVAHIDREGPLMMVHAGYEAAPS